MSGKTKVLLSAVRAYVVANDTAHPLHSQRQSQCYTVSSTELHGGHDSQVSGKLMEPPAAPRLHQVRSLHWWPHSFQKVLRTVHKRH